MTQRPELPTDLRPTDGGASNLHRSGGELTDVPATGRRAVLRGTGLAALALGGGGLLAACSTADETTAPGAEPSPTTGTSPGPTEDASTSPSTPAEEDEGAEDEPVEEGGVQLAAADVPVGGGVIMPDADFVVTQPSAGEFRAFSKICTHQGCPVSEVAGAEIVCFCHGSAFSSTDGSVLQGPATEALAETPVTAEGDQLRIG